LELNPTNSNEFSWPILLAIIPTLGAFFAGSAEIWSDFVMILLILYYVYKWMTGNEKDKNTERANVKRQNEKGCCYG
jgi:Ca2+/Na+ antiporter